MGPHGLSLVTDVKLLADISHVGIIFLLFLLGLDMQPRALWITLRKSTVVAILSSGLFLAMGCIALRIGCNLIVLDSEPEEVAALEATPIDGRTRDALASFGVKHIDMPLRPKRVWQAMQNAQG